MTVIHNDTVSEASNVLSLLPVFLESRFGAQIWQWFSTECRAEMSTYIWDEDEQQVVSTKGSDEESDSPSITPNRDPLAAWETVDDDDVKKDQADHKFDLSTLFNFAPRDGKDFDSGYDDAGSLRTFTTGISQLTKNIGTFTDPIFQAKEEKVVDKEVINAVMPPVNSIPNSPSGAASSMGAITSDSLTSPLSGAALVALAPPAIRSCSNSPAHSTPAMQGEEQSPIAANEASLRQTGVILIND